MKSLKPLLEKKYSWFYLLLFALFLAFVFTFFIHNIAYFSKDFKGDYLVSNTSKISEEDGVTFLYKDLNRYVREISFKSNLKTNEKKAFSIWTTNDKGEETLLKTESLYLYYDGKVYLNINKDVKDIKFVFEDLKSEDIDIKEVAVHNNFTFNIVYFCFYTFVFFALLYLWKSFLLKKSLNLSYVFLYVSLFCGTMFAFLTPFGYSMDEKEHFIRSYNVASFNINLNKEEQVMWPSKIDTLLNDPYNSFIPNTYHSYLGYFENLKEKGNSEKINKYYPSTAEPYLFGGYLISGLGILIAQMMHLSFPMQIILGRLFNTIFFSLIVFLSIKLAGKYEKIFFVVGLIPLMLFQAGSYSADMFTNAMSILSVALTLYYASQKEKIKLSQLLLLTICYTSSFISKIAYFPLVLLIFCLPNEKFKSKKSALFLKFLIVFIILMFFGYAYLYASKHGIVQWASSNVDSTGQIKFIIKHPFSYLNVLYKTLDSSLYDFLYSATSQLGYVIGLGGIHFWLLLILCFISVTACSYKISIKNRFILFLVIIGILGVSMSSLYISFTPVSYGVVLGFQGRYLLPIFVPTLIFASSSKIKNLGTEKNINYLLVIGMLCLNAYAMWEVLFHYFC